MRRELVSNRILERATELFAQRGFSGTSLQEVADSLQINRTALYHYIGGKQDLFDSLVMGLTRETADTLERVAKDPALTPKEKLRQAVAGMAHRIASNPARFRLLMLSEGAIEGDLAAEYLRARRRTLEALARIIQEGIDAGQVRPIDSHLAAFAALGICNWVAWWYRPDRIPEQTPDVVASTMADIAIGGLLDPDAEPERGDNPVESAVARLHADLAVLERSIRSSRHDRVSASVNATKKRSSEKRKPRRGSS